MPGAFKVGSVLNPQALNSSAEVKFFEVYCQKKLACRGAIYCPRGFGPATNIGRAQLPILAVTQKRYLFSLSEGKWFPNQCWTLFYLHVKAVTSLKRSGGNLCKGYVGISQRMSKTIPSFHLGVDERIADLNETISL